MLRIAAISFGAALLAAIPGARLNAGVLLHDDGSGMTCQFYLAAARLEWRKDGGDWRDATGAVFGPVPYASQLVSRQKGRQTIEWDVTDLARSWARGGVPAGAVYLRATDPDAKGIVNFFSREHRDKGAHPALVLEWSDGRTLRVEPTADAHFACPNFRGLGGKSVLQVGGGHAAVLVFPFDPTGATLRRATLVLTSNKQYSRVAEIAVFQAFPPSSDSSEIRHGIAERFSDDRGIDTDPDVIFAERFDSADTYAKWAEKKKKMTAEVVDSVSGDGYEPISGGSLRVRIKKGGTLGLNVHYRFADHGFQEPESAYFRYYLRLGESWNPVRDGGKLPGLSGTYGRAGWGGRRADGTNGWSARGAFFKQSDAASPMGSLRGIGSYVYYAGMGSSYGDAWGWNRAPTGLLEKNRWYSVEQYVRLNTPGNEDGVLRAWIDGHLVFERENIRFRDVSDLKIESIWMNVYHGGTSRAPADMTLYIDNLVVAQDYIGPMRRAR